MTESKIIIHWPTGEAELSVCHFFPAKQGKLKRMMKLLTADFEYRDKTYDDLIVSLEQYILALNRRMIQLSCEIDKNQEALEQNRHIRTTRPIPSGSWLKALQAENQQLKEDKSRLRSEYRETTAKIERLRANLKWLRGARTW